MSYFVPTEERIDRDGIAALHREKLGRMLAAVAPTNAFYHDRLDPTRFNPETDDLARLPFTTRDEIQHDQADHPPYGTNLTFPIEQYVRLHQTSGSTGTPMRWLDTLDSWKWWKRCWGIIYRAAGVNDADRLFFPFSFGPFIGFWGAFEGAAKLGNFVLPGGAMTSAARLHHMIQHRATVVCCTPTYALRLAEVAEAEGIDLRATSIRALIVAGEPGGSIPATRRRIEEHWNARVFDHAGMTEVGAWGFECVEAPGGMHVNEADFIAEVIDPTSGETVGDGQGGELVLTNLGRWGSPLIRYRTGDQVVLTRDRCACGRWFARADGGILGRLDDMIFIRGNNVYPSTIEGIVRRFDAVAEFSIRLDRDDAMDQLTVAIEPAADTQTDKLDQQVARAIRDSLHFSAKVVIVKPGTLPRFEMKAKRFQR